MKDSTILLYEQDSIRLERYISELKTMSIKAEYKIVQNLRTFLDYLNQFNPQLVVIGANVQGLGEILLGLRQNHQIRVPIIIIGQFEREQDFRLSVQNGAFDYISDEKIYRLSNSAQNAITLQLTKTSHQQC